MFRPAGRAPFARPKGAEKGGCHCSGRRACGATTALRCSPSTGGSETRPRCGLKQPTRLFRRRLRVSAEHRHRKPRDPARPAFEPVSRGRASQQAVDESARSAERGRDAEAVAVGPGWPVCNAHRLRDAQGTRDPEGGGPRDRAPFLFAGFLWASKENWLARQGETRLLAMGA